MRIEQCTRSGSGWSPVARPLGSRAQLALAFAPTTRLTEPQTWVELIALYPNARIVGCSTAGEIAGARVLDDALVVTALAFDHSGVAVAEVELDEAASDAERGELLTSRLPHDGLIHVLVLSTGNGVDGSALIAGITAGLPAGVAATGGLAGGASVASAVCLDGPLPSEQIVAIGFYGDRLRVGYGSLGACLDGAGPGRIDLAILISSVGRKRGLDRRIAAEVEAVRGLLGDAVTTGFYACGEIAPLTTEARCELHDQTMTITVLSER